MEHCCFCGSLVWGIRESLKNDVFRFFNNFNACDVICSNRSYLQKVFLVQLKQIRSVLVFLNVLVFQRGFYGEGSQNCSGTHFLKKKFQFMLGCFIA